MKLFPLTSGVLLPLSHCVNLEELNLSKELWMMSQYNDRGEKQGNHNIDIIDIMAIHPNIPDSDRLELHDRFNA